MNSIKMFSRSFNTKMARNANMKCSGTRLEVSRSRLEGWVWVGKGKEMGVKGKRQVFKCFQSHSVGPWEFFSSNFLIFDFYPISVRSLLNLSDILSLF